MIKRIRKWYIDFLEKKSYSFWERIAYLVFYFFSFLYGVVVYLRNFLYDFSLFSSYRARKPVISVGNISWAGTGKTTLVGFLFAYFSKKYKVAVLRRGYGDDEGQLFKDAGVKVFSAVDRVTYANTLSSEYEFFILDDGFQYRKLHRDINIVMMGAREFIKPIRLLPLSFFREPLSSLKRADILVINYASEIKDVVSVKRRLKQKFPQLNVFTARYIVHSFFDLVSNKEIPLDLLRQKKIAAFTAVGYPQGFLNLLNSLNLKLTQEIVYPDHYCLTLDEYTKLCSNLKEKGINTLMITAKDKYHFPKEIGTDLSLVVVNINIEIDNQEMFLKIINQKLD